MIRYLLLVVFVFLINGCGGEKKFPIDKNGLTPDTFLKNTFTLVLEEKYEDARKSYDEKYLKGYIEKDDSTFKGRMKKNVFGWGKSVSKLEVTRARKEYNDKSDMWLLSIHYETGVKGQNSPGVACNLKLLNGEWKIVHWMDYK